MSLKRAKYDRRPKKRTEADLVHWRGDVNCPVDLLTSRVEALSNGN